MCQSKIHTEFCKVIKAWVFQDFKSPYKTFLCKRCNKSSLEKSLLYIGYILARICMGTTCKNERRAYEVMHLEQRMSLRTRTWIFLWLTRVSVSTFYKMSRYLLFLLVSATPTCDTWTRYDYNIITAVDYIRDLYTHSVLESNVVGLISLYCLMRVHFVRCGNYIHVGIWYELNGTKRQNTHGRSHCSTTTHYRVKKSGSHRANEPNSSSVQFARCERAFQHVGVLSSRVVWIGRVSYIRISLCYFCFRWKTVSLVQASMQHLMHHVTVSLQ